jgi:hypothetical protein
MSVKADEYRVLASDCDKQAELATDPDVRASFREFARQWRQLANDAERVARGIDLPNDKFDPV